MLQVLSYLCGSRSAIPVGARHGLFRPHAADLGGEVHEPPFSIRDHIVTEGGADLCRAPDAFTVGYATGERAAACPALLQVRAPPQQFRSLQHDLAPLELEVATPLEGVQDLVDALARTPDHRREVALRHVEV